MSAFMVYVPLIANIPSSSFSLSDERLVFTFVQCNAGPGTMKSRAQAKGAVGRAFLARGAVLDASLFVNSQIIHGMLNVAAGEDVHALLCFRPVL
jgi:hypothetical protein